MVNKRYMISWPFARQLKIRECERGARVPEPLRFWQSAAHQPVFFMRKNAVSLEKDSTTRRSKRTWFALFKSL